MPVAATYSPQHLSSKANHISTISDSLSASNVINIANAPAASMGMVMTAMSDALGIAMENASRTQNNMQTIANTSTTTCCALMIAKMSG